MSCCQRGATCRGSPAPGGRPPTPPAALPCPALQTLWQTLPQNLFALSLFPYLGFLYYLTKSKQAPPLALFGFYFLLAFVGVSVSQLTRSLGWVAVPCLLLQGWRPLPPGPAAHPSHCCAVPSAG